MLDAHRFVQRGEIAAERRGVHGDVCLTGCGGDRRQRIDERAGLFAPLRGERRPMGDELCRRALGRARCDGDIELQAAIDLALRHRHQHGVK